MERSPSCFITTEKPPPGVSASVYYNCIQIYCRSMWETKYCSKAGLCVHVVCFCKSFCPVESLSLVCMSLVRGLIGLRRLRCATGEHPGR